MTRGRETSIPKLPAAMNNMASAGRSSRCVPPVRGRVGTPASSPVPPALPGFDVSAGAGVADAFEGDGEADPPSAAAAACPPSGDDDAEADGWLRAAWLRLEEWSS